ncbi:MAG: carbohydrate binding family 9 domain-containing protein [Acidobacteria bacterium]|nr:carbohydrate binding family 9 domain-containing protein [Acidobacteriota bacterium]
MVIRASVGCLLLIGLIASAGEAGQTGPVTGLAVPSASSSPALPFAIDGPPPPVPPAVMTRDAEGRVTLRAVRLTTPLRVDGRLDEAVYDDVPAISGFIQTEPDEGTDATEKTELWILFDDDKLYLVARCWESEPERLVANERRRDNNIVWSGNDVIGFALDTFYDRRNGVIFNVNPVGGRTDGQVTNERQYNGDWNPVWDAKVGRFEGGWTVETAIPFKSLRYRPGRSQIWGFNARRTSRWKNELTYLARIPRSLGQRGMQQVSMAAALVGLEVPPASMNLEVKPYATADLRSDLAAAPKVVNDVKGDAGLDVKYGVTQGLTADFTVNTDFAQVEADEQQVNLTRFSLFFPEKREFFLENQGVFSFGGAGTSGQGGGDLPILFYSRRIGLDQGSVVPIDAGGRLTGRLGRFNIGALNIQTGDQPASRSRATNFSVVRVRRDLLRRSSVGVIATGRSVAQNGVGRNLAYGVDGAFAFFENLAITTYWARTESEGRSGSATSYRAQLDYGGDRYGVQLERLAVGAAFNPDVGFVRRADMRRTFGQLRFSPRPRSLPRVRRFSFVASTGQIENGAGRLETREWDGEFAIEFANSDRFSLSYGDTYEFLPQPFRIAPGVTLPVGGYDFRNVRLSQTFGRQRPLSGTVSLEHGSFYSGRRTTLGLSQGRLDLSAQLTVEPSYSVNWVDLAEGAFTTHLLGSRVTYTMTPLMFVSTLVQFNSSTHAVTANARLRWEYRPGSELFVVYNERRDTLARGFPDLRDRAFIIKINRLVRF